MGRPPKYASEEEAFAARIEKRDQCWVWTGEIRQPSGFGVFFYRGSRSAAHRHAWGQERGPIPGNRAVRHTCGNKACVNVEHLYLGPKGTLPCPISDRFWKHVDKTPRCWLWTGAPHSSGYGRIGRPGGGSGMEFAHRASWELHNGEIPEGFYIAHTCDVKLCVNPEHLFLSEGNKDNMADAAEKKRLPHGLRHKDAKLSERDVAEIRERYRRPWPTGPE